jgi:hypothetical protein
MHLLVIPKHNEPNICRRHKWYSSRFSVTTPRCLVEGAPKIRRNIPLPLLGYKIELLSYLSDKHYQFEITWLVPVQYSVTFKHKFSPKRIYVFGTILAKKKQWLLPTITGRPIQWRRGLFFIQQKLDFQVLFRSVFPKPFRSRARFGCGSTHAC